MINTNLVFFQNDRQDILQVISNKVTLSENIDLHTIAAETINYTGADLNGLLYTAFSIAEKKSLKGLWNNFMYTQFNKISSKNNSFFRFKFKKHELHFCSFVI